MEQLQQEIFDMMTVFIAKCNRAAYQHLSKDERNVLLLEIEHIERQMDSKIAELKELKAK